MAPTPYQSGESGREHVISKAGNRHMRAMGVELAPQHDPGRMVAFVHAGAAPLKGAPPRLRPRTAWKRRTRRSVTARGCLPAAESFIGAPAVRRRVIAMYVKVVHDLRAVRMRSIR